MPRMEAESTDRSPENGDPASRLTLGVRLLRAWMSVTPLDRSVSVVIAVMAIGTFWMFSSRRCAVTTTSCSFSCATACTQTTATATPYSARRAWARNHLADETFMLVFSLSRPGKRPSARRSSARHHASCVAPAGADGRPAFPRPLSPDQGEVRFYLPELLTGPGNIEILLDRIRMLAHQRFHARALAALEGRYDAVMLTMCISHRVVHPLEARLVEGERLRAREWNACVALQSLLDDGTAALGHDEL